MYVNYLHKIINGTISFIIVLSSLFTVNSYNFKKTEIENHGIVVPIIMYHEVKPYNAGKDVITPYEIESDLKFLKENKYSTITMTDLIDYVYKNKELPENPIILSFDDGYLNNYFFVYPLLKKYNMKIVLSIIGKNTDDFTRIPDNNLDYSHVTWNQINEMIHSGHVEIQNHTYNMHKITPKRYGCRKKRGESIEHYEQILTEDIGKLQQEITLLTGFTPNTFAYPYGQVSKESVPIIKNLGFKASLSCDYGINIVINDPEMLYGLKRICRSHGVPIKKAIYDAMKTLKFKRK
jgi:peptidoglycan/xylan/chitin deacetylase (PgdA/CDA1 family)